MNFFDIVPVNFFNPLYSGNPNRELYIESLMILWEEYIQCNGIVKKGDCVSVLSAHFEKAIYRFKEEDDRKLEEANIPGYARYIIDRLIETQWLEQEDSLEFEDADIIIPAYSRKFLEAINDVQHNSAILKKFASSIYANLKTADEDPSMMYQCFSNAKQDSFSLHNSLTSMFSEIKRANQNLLKQAQANDILKEFDKYIINVLEKYHPMKTDENIYRYRTEIFRILSKWEYDEESLSIMGKQLRAENKQVSTDDDAKNEIIDAIEQVKKIFNEVDRTIANIDVRNSQYIRTTVDRVKYLLNQDKNFKGNLIKVINLIADAKDKSSVDVKTKSREELLEIVSAKLPVHGFDFSAKSSIYKPIKRGTEQYVPLPISVNTKIAREVAKNEMAEHYHKKSNSAYSENSVISFLEEKLNGKVTFNTKEITIAEDVEYVKLIIAYKLCTQKKIPFRIQVKSNILRINNYLIPEMIFSREAR